MRTGFLIIIVWALAAACAVYAGEEAPEPDEYVVWVDQLNLRAGPSTEAEVVTVLRRGNHAEYVRPEVIEKEDYVWRKVRYAAYEGWVADRYVLREDIFNAFKDVILYAADYDAAGMLAAVMEGNRRAGIEPQYETYYCSVSPDGEKIILELGYSSLQEGAYADLVMGGLAEQVLYFKIGEGLVDHLTWTWHERGMWDKTSRYYACPACPVSGYPLPLDLMVYDTAQTECKSLGWCFTNVDIPREEWEPNNRPYIYQFADGYLIWYTVEDAMALGLDLDFLPVLMAYELSSGREIKLLEADITTLGDERIPGSSWDYYKVKLVPAAPCPPVIEKAELYNKYNGGSGYAWSGNA
jgi:hypothetical protein